MSKTSKKKRMHELQQLGVRIAACNEQLWNEIGLDDNTRAAMREYARLSREARRRQAQYIGKLLRGYDADALYGYFTRQQQAQLHRDALAAKLPDWYRALVAKTRTVAALVENFPEVDRQRLENALAAIATLDENTARHLPVPPQEKAHRLLWQVLLDGLPGKL